MTKPSRPAPSRHSPSRRQILKQGAALGALPFALLIPTAGLAVPLERMRPLYEREAEFKRQLEEKMAQLPGRMPPGSVTRPPPPPPRAVINTPVESTTGTKSTVATFSKRGPKLVEVSDDTNYVEYSDDKTTRYIND